MEPDADYDRLASLLERWGENTLSAAVGASALMDAAMDLATSYERNGLPDWVPNIVW